MKKTVLLVIVCCLFLSIGGCTSIKVEIKTDRNDDYVSLNSEESGKLLSLFEETEKTPSPDGHNGIGVHYEYGSSFIIQDGNEKYTLLVQYMYPLIIRITGSDEQKYEVWAVDEFSALYDYLREIKYKYENKEYRCLFDEIRLALINEDNSDNCNLGEPLTSLVAYDLNNQLVYSDNYAASSNMKMNRLLELLGEKPDEGGDLTLGEVYLREKGEYKLNEVMDYQGLKIKYVGESVDREGNQIQGFIIKANCSEIYFPGMN